VDRWVVASRLTPEKGVFELVNMWPSNYDLDIYGNGEEHSLMAAAAIPKIGIYERIEQMQLAKILPRYTGMVFPSRVWENVPGAVLMAFGAGLPVVAREGSVGADLVTKYEAGKTFFDLKSLEAALMQVVQKRELYSRNAALAYELNFTDASWLKRTEQELDSLVPLRVA
jgi:glycosyltransferase involved in cell wall biosynthesis